jgi:hypothetical protein
MAPDVMIILFSLMATFFALVAVMLVWTNQILQLLASRFPEYYDSVGRPTFMRFTPKNYVNVKRNYQTNAFIASSGRLFK